MNIVKGHMIAMMFEIGLTIGMFIIATNETFLLLGILVIFGVLSIHVFITAIIWCLGGSFFGLWRMEEPLSVAEPAVAMIALAPTLETEALISFLNFELISTRKEQTC